MYSCGWWPMQSDWPLPAACARGAAAAPASATTAAHAKPMVHRSRRCMESPFFERRTAANADRSGSAAAAPAVLEKLAGLLDAGRPDAEDVLVRERIEAAVLAVAGQLTHRGGRSG